MAKLIVKDPKTGVTRPMTQRSYDMAAGKRGWKIVGREEEPKSVIQQEMDRLRAEKAAKDEGHNPGVDLDVSPVVNHPEDAVKSEAIERKKPGPKPKSKAE